MYSKISRGKPSHQLKEKNEKAEYHSWSVSLPTTAAEKKSGKNVSYNYRLGVGLVGLEIISKHQKCIYDCTTYFQQFCTLNNVPAIEYYSNIGEILERQVEKRVSRVSISASFTVGDLIQTGVVCLVTRRWRRGGRQTSTYGRRLQDAEQTSNSTNIAEQTLTALTYEYLRGNIYITQILQCRYLQLVIASR